MNEMSDMCSNMCSSIGKGAECFHSSPLREKSYSPKRRISLANPQHIELAKLNFDYSNQVVSAKLSPRSQFQVVGNYDILKTIGKGQFGKVKLAKHVLTNDLVCFEFFYYCSPYIIIIFLLLLILFILYDSITISIINLLLYYYYY